MAIISLNSVNQLIFVMETHVFFAVGTQFLNIIQMSSMLQGLCMHTQYWVALMCCCIVKYEKYYVKISGKVDLEISVTAC
jgi:hypothetical protein